MAAPPVSSARRILRLVLVAALLVTVLWAAARLRRHDARTRWVRPLDVAVVLLAEGGLPAQKAERVRAGLPALEAMFRREYRRHRDDGLVPFTFSYAGAATVTTRPPLPGDGAALTERAALTVALTKWLKELHARDGIDVRGADVRIYVLLEPAGRGPLLVEGLGAEGGDFGFVFAQLDDDNLDLLLTAIGHELLHTLRATDKYTPEGRSQLPEGLPEPMLEPLYPQRFAEIMVGERALGPQEGRVPDSLDEVAVGPVTAREIRWAEE